MEWTLNRRYSKITFLSLCLLSIFTISFEMKSGDEI